MSSETTLSEAEILAIERPEPSLLAYYVLSCFSWGPAFPLRVLFGFFRYRTLRYRITREGVSMSWGALFHREIHLTYARIQDIHLTSNVIERWLGLARIQIQTASGAAKAEMTIEGIAAYQALRDFLYGKMRGARGIDRPSAGQAPFPDGDVGELAVVLREVAAELRALREELRARASAGGGQDG